MLWSVIPAIAGNNLKIYDFYTYRRRVGVHNFARKLLALQFLPVSLIRRAFDNMSETATTDGTRALIASRYTTAVDGEHCLQS